MLTADCQNSGIKGRDLVFTLPFFQRATLKTHRLTIKIKTKKPKNVRNCESSAKIKNNFLVGWIGENFRKF
jgi:hypothetical protein